MKTSPRRLLKRNYLQISLVFLTAVVFLYSGLAFAQNTEKKSVFSNPPAPMKETSTAQTKQTAVPKQVPVQKASPALTPTPAKVKPAVQAPRDMPKLIRYAFLNGTRYVNLNDVAAFYKMNFRQYTKFILLKNKSHQLQLFLHSRKAYQDSIAVTFHFPLESKNGTWYISELDFRTILNPMYQQKLPLRLPLRTIMIDAGHGGKDVGAKGIYKNEQTINLEIAQKLRIKLESLGFKVYMTRTGDTYPTLPERCMMCSKQKPDIFISIHCNSHARKNVSGIETYLMTPKGAPSSSETKPQNTETLANRYDQNSFKLAYSVQKALVHSFPKTEDRGVKHARFYVLKNASCPAILIETGFISNPKEERVLSSSVAQIVIVDSILHGLTDYLNAIK